MGPGNTAHSTAAHDPASNSVCTSVVTEEGIKEVLPLPGVGSPKRHVEFIHSFPVNTHQQKRREFYFYSPSTLMRKRCYFTEISIQTEKLV